MSSNKDMINNADSDASAAGSSTGRKSCHQCKRIKTPVVRCKGEKCSLIYCKGCLSKRYDNEEGDISRLDTWACPRCNKICNCSECKKKIGGHAVAKRQATELGLDTLAEAAETDRMEMANQQKKARISSASPKE